MIVNQTVLSRVATQVTNRSISRGAALYQRDRDLPKLFGKGAENWDHLTIIARLENRLRGAREAVRKGHWAASPNRVAAIRMALHAELGYGRGE